jgi:hypothetical protein
MTSDGSDRPADPAQAEGTGPWARPRAAPPSDAGPTGYLARVRRWLTTHTRDAPAAIDHVDIPSRRRPQKPDVPDDVEEPTTQELHTGIVAPEDPPVAVDSEDASLDDAQSADEADGNGEAVTQELAALEVAPDEEKGNPNIRRYLELLAAVFALVAEGLALDKDLPLLAVTQYLCAAGVLAIAVIQLDHISRKPGSAQLTVPSGQRVGIWLVAWVFVIVTAVTQRPDDPWLVGAYGGLAWLFLFAGLKCSLDRMPRIGTVRHRLWMVAASAKQALGGRKRAAFSALVIAGAVAVCSTASALIVAVAPKTVAAHVNRSPKGPTPKEVLEKEEKKDETSQDPNGHAEEGEGASSGTSNGSCNRHKKFSEAEWAASEIEALLDGGTVLGPKEEGCVDTLDTEFFDETGFVYGVGISSETHRPISIVTYGTKLQHPSIFIAPALGLVETIIARYHVVEGDGKKFPRYDAVSGDFYLANTGGQGTCVIIRSKSGEPNQALPYELLYPAEAAAWLRIMQIRTHWQWPVREAKLNDKGEEVIKLFTPGNGVPDATITAVPDGGEAHWKEYKSDFPYPAAQRNLDPEELEDDVKKYLIEK